MAERLLHVVSFYARTKDILNCVKARRKEYALGTVHGTLLCELSKSVNQGGGHVKACHDIVVAQLM